jgi:putative ATP-binding cassette transporter
MNLFSLLAKRAPNKVFFSILVGMLSGTVYSLLIPLIMASLDGIDGAGHVELLGLDIANPVMALVFLGAVLFIWATRTWVDITMTQVSMAATSALRVELYYRIAQAPLAAIEKIGLPRLITAISGEMPAVVSGAQTAQTMLIDMVTLFGMLGFLAYVNVAVFWFVLKGIVFGVLSYQLIFVFANRYFFRAAQVNDSLQRSVHGLMHGFKELKLSDEKRRSYFEQGLLENERALLEAQRPGSVIHSSAANYGLMLNFMFLGAIAFIFVSTHALSAQNLSSIMMVMLYISMPIGSVTSKIPGLAVARIAIGRLNALLDELPQESLAAGLAPVEPWRSVRFDQVAYAHAGQDGQGGFALGPIDLEFRKGEITFIVGGNGSGKSTLSKLLTLHYHATAGAIHFGGVRITGANMNSYRQDISAIYADYHLFDRILAANGEPARVEHYLKQLGLEGKVSYRDGRFSTLALSDGQRRRMALVAAFMEDRELYLFDEWAADQDPSFKEIFYREILPSLKARDKAVVVISHDDRYFDVADRLVHMSEGQVKSVRQAAPQARLA